MLSADGLLAQLQARGYEVSAPWAWLLAMDMAISDAREIYLPQAWYKGLTASLGLHVVLLAWIAGPWSGGSPADELASTESRPAALQLTFATRNPQRPLPAPFPADIASAESSLVSSETALVEVTLVEAVQERAGIEAIPESPPVPEDLANTLASLQDSVLIESAAAPTPDTSATEADGMTYSAPQLRSTISTYVRSTRQELTGEWLAACRIYRKEHGTRDCPQQAAEDYSGGAELKVLARQAFASVLRPQEHARLRTEFAASMASMKPLMEADGVLGELAAQRYYRDKGYLDYLSGNVDTGILGFVQASQGIQYDPTFLQALCSPAPCIFEYTGVGAKAAATPANNQNPDAEEGAADAPTPFMLQQTLFGSPR